MPSYPIYLLKKKKRDCCRSVYGRDCGTCRLSFEGSLRGGTGRSGPCTGEPGAFHNLESFERRKRAGITGGEIGRGGKTTVRNWL